MGYDTYYVGRIDHEDKKVRLEQKKMEMLWQGSNLNESETMIFTGVTFSRYDPPLGFYWELGTINPPIQDDPNLENPDINFFVDLFIANVLEQVNRTIFFQSKLFCQRITTLTEIG